MEIPFEHRDLSDEKKALKSKPLVETQKQSELTKERYGLSQVLEEEIKVNFEPSEQVYLVKDQSCELNQAETEHEI